MADTKQTVPPAKPTPEPGEDVTYCPGEGDPPVAKWRGVEFKANLPVRVTREDLIAAARLNRFFRVGATLSPQAPIGAPKTALEYRAYVVDWIKGCESIDQISAHWAADRQLRFVCEVGPDDISFLGTLVEPKLRALRLAGGLTEMQVAEIWVKHGTLEFPWRS
jgi:hypothetical protein